MALNAPYTTNTIIQSTQVSNDLVGLANGTNDTTNNSMSTFRSDAVFDHVSSGCVWSGDSYAVNKNASQTAGVVYISGVRLTVASVTGRTFTASVDTYTDVNGSGVQVYTEVSNNAASPALTAGNIRIGIIVTGATTIAAATSVNQGQETMVLPIASSIAYSVTDSLGNLICPRDPHRKLLGYKQIVANQTTITAAVDVTGLAAPVIIPTGRKIKIITRLKLTSTVSADTAGSFILETATTLDSSSTAIPATGSNYVQFLEVVTSPSVGLHTYKAQASRVGGTGTISVIGASTGPSFIKIELE